MVCPEYHIKSHIKFRCVCPTISIPGLGESMATDAVNLRLDKAMEQHAEILYVYPRPYEYLEDQIPHPHGG